MTRCGYVLPIVKRRILFLVYDGFELLDVSAPSAVFSTANKLSGQALYDIRLLSERGGAVRASCGITTQTEPWRSKSFAATDTVLVAGAYEEPLRRACTSRPLRACLCRASEAAERYGSVCAGTFVLAAAGLLEAKRAATHWSACQRLQAFAPTAAVESDSMYVRDGSLWTSAGVSTGLDMALAMVSSDHGRPLSARIAKQLVVYLHRPGHQSQFSDVLDAQYAADGAYSELIAFMDTHLHESLRVADLAKFMGQSERTFYRRFTAAVGVTPAKFLDSRRLHRAKAYLEGGESVQRAADRTGFRSESAFRTAFRGRFGVSPSEHRRHHPAR